MKFLKSCFAVVMGNVHRSFIETATATTFTTRFIKWTLEFLPTCNCKTIWSRCFEPFYSSVTGCILEGWGTPVGINKHGLKIAVSNYHLNIWSKFSKYESQFTHFWIIVQPIGCKKWFHTLTHDCYSSRGWPRFKPLHSMNLFLRHS